ncbi:MAG: thiamine pyrophosphate-binding protein [Treponema sp.]|jgi:acetolactate synthase-1/2/3 large subunit|nr:thiamine pyrophosphate-binding protein [Treponema sp.]
MKVSDYFVDFLIKNEVTDVFGMPGGVILDFLDSMGKRKEKITAHLNYNEQASAFAACGYAQVFGKLAVAYATRGPGITNMITGIADSFCGSLPCVFITAHSHKSILADIRIETDQEFDTVRMLSPVTKYAVKIENADDVRYEVEKACYLAANGRPGPVLLDFLTNVLKADINPEMQRPFIPAEPDYGNYSSCDAIVKRVKSELGKAKRPIILIGDGIWQSNTQEYIKKLARKWNIPILSSRSAQDIVPDYENYYGYIGSHAARYGNFILSKCDLIIALGNRLMFNPDSKSFGVLTHRAKIIRIDIDKNEFLREIPNAVNFVCDLKKIMPPLAECAIEWKDSSNWIPVCKEIKEALYVCDTGYPVNIISEIIKNAGEQTVITSDVGNNEFWLSRAYAFSGASNRVLYSKSFGALGCSLPKAVGAYYSTKNRVLCFTGDQGLQMNLQELNFVAKENLPVSIILLNNFSSEMIRDQQEKKFGSRFMCTTAGSGYSAPKFKKLADAFGINYICFDAKTGPDAMTPALNGGGPVFIEVLLDENAGEIPYLPMGRPMQNLVPEIDGALYQKLERL